MIYEQIHNHSQPLVQVNIANSGSFSIVEFAIHTLHYQFQHILIHLIHSLSLIHHLTILLTVETSWKCL